MTFGSFHRLKSTDMSFTGYWALWGVHIGSMFGILGSSKHNPPRSTWSDTYYFILHRNNILKVSDNVEGTVWHFSLGRKCLLKWHRGKRTHWFVDLTAEGRKFTVVYRRGVDILNVYFDNRGLLRIAARIIGVQDF